MNHKDLSSKAEKCRKQLSSLTSVDDSDQSTSQIQFKSFAHVERTSSQLIANIETLINSNCAKYAAAKTCEKLYTSKNSRDIDLTVNHLTSEAPEDDDHRNLTNITTSRISTSSTGLSMLQAATPEFALSALPPGKTEAEQKLVQLIDECAEEKKEVEAQLEILQGLLQKMKDNDQTLRNLDAELKASQKGKETVENVQEQVEKLKTEIKKLKIKEKEVEEEEKELKAKLEDGQREAESLETSSQGEVATNKQTERMQERLAVIETLTSWPVTMDWNEP